jgi:hypothetical protein
MPLTLVFESRNAVFIAFQTQPRLTRIQTVDGAFEKRSFSESRRKSIPGGCAVPAAVSDEVGKFGIAAGFAGVAVRVCRFNACQSRNLQSLGGERLVGLHESAASHSRRARNLKNCFGHHDPQGECPVQTSVGGSKGHVVRGHDRQLCGNLIFMSTLRLAKHGWQSQESTENARA